jgi:polyketide biosynthesis enoyl-CoA hydratase PksH
MSYQTIRVRFQEPICFIQFHRPERNNTINAELIDECHQSLDQCEESITVVVLEGTPEMFCFGADFQGMFEEMGRGQSQEHDPAPMYDLWERLATGPFITIAHVRGKANAGGVGFVAASDIALADETAQFGLPELLFGLLPACVLPFLVRRVGFQKAHYLTLTTQPISAQQAHAWGLVDAYEKQSESLLRKHLLRLRRISKTSIRQYKKYLSESNDLIAQLKPLALATNREAFSDTRNLAGIARYVEKGLFPWEQE